MSSAVLVSILKLETRRNPPGATMLWEVHNDCPQPIWMVNDNWIIWTQQGGDIEISLARGRMRKASAVFGYFAPAVREIPAGSAVSNSLDLSWPLKLDGLWNRDTEVMVAPGHYNLRLRIGYGETPEPPNPEPGEGVEEPVLRWQREAVSVPVPLEVPEGSAEPPVDVRS